MQCGDTMQRSLRFVPPFLKNLLDTDFSRPYDALDSCVSVLERSIYRVDVTHPS